MRLRNIVNLSFGLCVTLARTEAEGSNPGSQDENIGPLDNNMPPGFIAPDKVGNFAERNGDYSVGYITLVNGSPYRFVLKSQEPAQRADWGWIDVPSGMHADP
jgi:hypothetical protein